MVHVQADQINWAPRSPQTSWAEEPDPMLYCSMPNETLSRDNSTELKTEMTACTHFKKTGTVHCVDAHFFPSTEYTRLYDDHLEWFQDDSYRKTLIAAVFRCNYTLWQGPFVYWAHCYEWALSIQINVTISHMKRVGCDESLTSFGSDWVKNMKSIISWIYSTFHGSKYF